MHIPKYLIQTTSAIANSTKPALIESIVTTSSITTSVLYKAKTETSEYLQKS